MQDTWGIPGPTFIACYLTAIVAVAILAAVHRKILFRGARNARVDDLGAQQVAFLSGGDQLAIYSSLGGLRQAGLIGSGPGHTVLQTGPLPAGVTPLDAAIHNAAGRQIRGRDLIGDQWVRSALDQLRDGLERRGLVVSTATMRTARIWVWVIGAVVLIGVLRLVAGTMNDKPVGFLFPLVFAAVALLIWTTRRKRVATTGAVQGLRGLRDRHDHLSPRNSPAYATYGAAGAAMGVALFGAASLYDMDPAFAAEAEIRRAVASGGYDGSSSSCSSGSSCSGSSSCSGGSSCGGGGGCGG